MHPVPNTATQETRNAGYLEACLLDALLLSSDWEEAERVFHGPPLTVGVRKRSHDKHSPRPCAISFPPLCQLPLISSSGAPQPSLNRSSIRIPLLLYFAIRADLGAVKWLLDHGADSRVTYSCLLESLPHARITDRPIAERICGAVPWRALTLR